MFKAHSKSFVFLGLQASGSDCSLNTCCVSLFKPPHWGEKSYWWEALKTGTGLCMMPKRHHGGGKMAQGLKWKGQRWAAQIHSVLSKSWRREHSRQGRTTRGLPDSWSKGAHGPGQAEVAHEFGHKLQRSPEHKTGRHGGDTLGWCTPVSTCSAFPKGQPLYHLSNPGPHVSRTVF